MSNVNKTILYADTQVSEVLTILSNWIKRYEASHQSNSKVDSFIEDLKEEIDRLQFPRVLRVRSYLYGDEVVE